MNDLLPPRNFCAAAKRVTRLFFPAIAHKMHWCQEFFLGENKKRAPRGVLSSNEILAVFIKKKLQFLDWSILSRHDEMRLVNFCLNFAANQKPV